MKRHVMLLAFLLTGLFLSAEEPLYLMVTLKDGTREIIGFDKQPTVTYEYGEMWIKSYQGQLTYAPAEVVRFDIGDSSMGVHDVNIPGMKYTITGNIVVAMEGLGTGGTVEVYDASGRQTANMKPDSTGRLTVTFETEPAGVYIIKVNSKRTIKVVKR